MPIGSSLFDGYFSFATLFHAIGMSPGHGILWNNSVFADLIKTSFGFIHPCFTMLNDLNIHLFINVPTMQEDPWEASARAWGGPTPDPRRSFFNRPIENIGGNHQPVPQRQLHPDATLRPLPGFANIQDPFHSAFHDAIANHLANSQAHLIPMPPRASEGTTVTPTNPYRSPARGMMQQPFQPIRRA